MWQAEIGVKYPAKGIAYGTTASEAMAKAKVLALRVLAARLEHNEAGSQAISILTPAA